MWKLCENSTVNGSSIVGGTSHMHPCTKACVALLSSMWLQVPLLPNSATDWLQGCSLWWIWMTMNIIWLYYVLTMNHICIIYFKLGVYPIPLPMFSLNYILLCSYETSHGFQRLAVPLFRLKDWSRWFRGHHHRRLFGLSEGGNDHRRSGWFYDNVVWYDMVPT